MEWTVLHIAECRKYTSKLKINGKKYCPVTYTRIFQISHVNLINAILWKLCINKLYFAYWEKCLSWIYYTTDQACLLASSINTFPWCLITLSFSLYARVGNNLNFWKSPITNLFFGKTKVLFPSVQIKIFNGYFYSTVLYQA